MISLFHLAGMQSYQNSLSLDVTAYAGGKVSPNYGAKFSLSTGFQFTSSSINKQSRTFIQSSARCQQYYASILTPKVEVV